MTYRQDADFRKQYGAIWEIKEPPPEGNETNNYINKYGIDHKYISQNKSKKIAWFVSNCQTKAGERNMSKTYKRTLR